MQNWKRQFSHSGTKARQAIRERHFTSRLKAPVQRLRVLRSSSPTRPRAKGQRLTSPCEQNHLNMNSMAVSSSSACTHPPLSPLRYNASRASTLITALHKMHKPTESDASQNVQPTDHSSPKMRANSSFLLKCATCLPLTSITPDLYPPPLGRGLHAPNPRRRGFSDSACF